MKPRFVTARDYWAARAPKDIPYDFEPKLSTSRPDGDWNYRHNVTGETRGDYFDDEVELTEEEESHWDHICFLQGEWDREHGTQKRLQWPWAYADMMLAAGEVVR